MALSKKPVNGMKDILPAEMEIRDYVTSVIKDTYRSFGFTPIETPCMENIANLSNKQGGENEKLIFKVLKRGEKLNLETAKEEADVVDFGMRYDLTVPLSRFYANHANDLPTPFKALQIGSVWRADRPASSTGILEFSHHDCMRFTSAAGDGDCPDTDLTLAYRPASLGTAHDAVEPAATVDCH